MANRKSEAVQSLDELQAKLLPTLKECGFRARGRAFNRPTSDGLTEVVQIQMSGFDPPGFTINLGVFVPEVAKQLGGGGASKTFFQEYHCCVRTRLPVLGPERDDIWWSLPADESLAEELRQRFERDAVPFFRKFESRDAILDQWLAVPKSRYAFAPATPRVVCAIILAKRGRNEDARRLLAGEVRETANPQHHAHVERLADKLGLGDLGAF